MANTSSLTRSLSFYYCNDSYSVGEPDGDDNCVNFGVIEPTGEYNHTHNISKHQILSFPINVTDGLVNEMVVVTNKSYFLVNGKLNSANTWEVFYISNQSRSGANQISSNKGTSWSDLSGTFDAHLHQFNGIDKLYYYVCANDSFGNQNCSIIKEDLLELKGLPPTSPSIYNPIEYFYSGNININYTQSISPNSYPIIHYNISLLNSTEGFVKDIMTNTSNLSYGWDSSSETDGEYYIRVRAYDNQGKSAFGLSNNFTLDNTAPTFINLTNQTIYENETLSYQVNATDSGIGIANFSINWTTTFNITIGGLLTNNTELINTTYFINITATDNLSNRVSKVIAIFVLNETVLDTIPPTFDNLRNVTCYINQTCNFSMYASDNVAVNNYTLNDTSIFNISQIGVIINISEINASQIINLELNVSDTSNNSVLGIFYINITLNVTESTPVVSSPGGGGSSDPVERPNISIILEVKNTWKFNQYNKLKINTYEDSNLIGVDDISFEYYNNSQVTLNKLNLLKIESGMYEQEFFVFDSIVNKTNLTIKTTVEKDYILFDEYITITIQKQNLLDKIIEKTKELTKESTAFKYGLYIIYFLIAIIFISLIIIILVLINRRMENTSLLQKISNATSFQ